MTETRERTASPQRVSAAWQSSRLAMLHSELCRTTRAPKVRQPRVQPSPTKEYRDTMSGAEIPHTSASKEGEEKDEEEEAT